MNLNYLLEQVSIDPNSTLCMRHRPVEPRLRRAFLWLAADSPDVFNAYQSVQKPSAERQLMNATHLASFIGDQAGRAVFVGLYKNNGHRITSFSDRQQIDSWKELVNYGVPNFLGDMNWFDLEPLPQLSKWSGKLVIEWKSERSWSRWAGKNAFNVLAINLDSLLKEDIPDWRNMLLSWNDLRIIPTRWRSALAEWRGIYFIYDVDKRQGYVGSAYGGDNILGRWENYAKTGHGGNKLLLDSNPEDLRFSILERLSPDTPFEEMIERENTWKERLHTRKYGMNIN